MNQPDNEDLAALRDTEQERIAPLKERSPELFTRPKIIDPDEVLTRIGIINLPARTKGYIRFTPADFIVEEYSSHNDLSTIEPESTPTDLDYEAPTFYAGLVKIGLGTPEAISQIASQLNVTVRQIGYAGLKDAGALTSQRISIRHADWRQMSDKNTGQLFIKPKSTGKGAISIGQLKGNRFTIFVRTETPANQQTLSGQANTLQAEGIPNYYGVQRFGNRLLNPVLGKLLCQGKPAEAIRLYLTAPSILDTPIYQGLRRRASQCYEDPAELKKVFDKLPYSFRNERTLLNAITTHPNNWPKILASIEDQVRFWVYGYASYLINRLLSSVLNEELSIPDPLPLPLGGPRTDKLYAKYLTKHDTVGYQQHLRSYPFIIQKERTLIPWIMPEVHKIATLPAGAIISFTLPKAAYATTFLMFLFQVHEGTPVPSWVKEDNVDSKTILGTGSVAQALSQLSFPPQTKK